MGLKVIGGRRTRYQFIQAVQDLPANQDPQSQVLNWGPEPGPGETRDLLVGICFATSSGVEPDTLTVGGGAASRLVGHAPPGVFTIGQAFWLKRQQTGTSGLIEFGVPSGDIDGGAIGVWAAYNLKSATPVATRAVAAFGAGFTDLSLQTLGGGAVIALASISNTNARSLDYVGVLEDSANETPNTQQWMASALGVIAEASRPVQLIRDDGFSVSAVAVSLR